MTESMFKGTPIRKGFATDPDKENQGVWRDHDSGISVKIRRGNRLEHKRALRKFYKPFAHLNSVDPKDEMTVKMRAGAQELVAAWGVIEQDEEGNPVVGPDGDPVRDPLTNAEGEEIRCTEENVLKAFQEQPDFFQWVTEEADTFEHYRINAVEESAGNSRPISAGNGDGATLPPQRSSSVELPGESQSLPSKSDPS